MNQKRFSLKTAAFMLLVAAGGTLHAQQVNDNNTPLHLMKPAYTIGYGISKPAEIKAVMDRVLRYIERETPAVLEDAKTGVALTDMKKITPDTRLRQGGFRLTSYEWGVTYSGVLAAFEATGDDAYAQYVESRLQLLSEMAPYFEKIYAKNPKIDPNVRRVIDPHALDDAGAICCAMIKARKSVFRNAPRALQTLLDERIRNYADYIMHKEFRLADGTFARIRPQRNTVWLDDMFMGIPTVAYMGYYTGEMTYYDEAAKQVLLFADKMFLPERGLFRHGWIEANGAAQFGTGTDVYHPAFHWGRANGWAILTMCEVLDVLPEDHPSRAKILSLLRAHARGLARLQHHDGMWHQLLDRDDTYLETSATAIYCYCLAHAVNNGWISAKAFGPVAQLAWHAIESQVSAEGQVMNVCVGTGMGFEPAFYAYRPVHPMAAHGYGPVIWAGAEMLHMLKEQHPKMNDSAVQFYDEPINTDAPIFNVDGGNRF
ncbi:MAG: glycoside hydrolase family 88 protein [Prevotella sp.]|nr:glycoside hydrolase family 88 protein [Prevotella sp.]